MDARRLDDLIPIPGGAIPGELLYTTTTGGTTASGSWVDIENFDGDLVVVLDVHSVTGSGSVNLQMSVSAANTGAGSVNAVDPGGTSLAPTAVGVYLLALGVDYQPQIYLGCTLSLTGFTATTSTVSVLGRKRIGP